MDPTASLHILEKAKTLLQLPGTNEQPTDHSPIILTMLSHLTEHVIHTKIHWLRHKQIHFHRGRFNRGYIHTLIHTVSKAATVMLPPIFH
jgi:hypothetical protein